MAKNNSKINEKSLKVRLVSNLELAEQNRNEPPKGTYPGGRFKRFFDTFKAYSMERNTGHNSLRMITEYTEDLETLGSIFVYKANNKFRFAIPPDIVYDIHKNIHDATNLVTHSIYHDEDKVLLPDMIDNHLVLELTINNINTQKLLKVNSFIINFDENIT